MTMPAQPDTIPDLAARYGLTTADTLPARLAPPEDHQAAVRAKWSPQKRVKFRQLGMCALHVVGTAGPVSMTLYDALGNVTRRIGHNRGVWPVRLARSSSWKDTVTTTYNRSPFVWTGTQIRVWCRNDAEEKRLALAVADKLGAMAEEAMGAELLGDFVDVGPEIDFALLEMDIHAIAERLGLTVLDDDGLSRLLDRLVAEDAAQTIERRRVRG